MYTMWYHPIVRNISSVITLSDEELDFFVSMLEVRTYPRKEYLLRKGEVCRHDFYIANGLVKVCYIDNKGDECIIKFAPEDWWVIDLDSFIHVKPSFYYIQALEQTEVFQISRSNYDLLLTGLPQFYKFSSNRWQAGFLALQQRLMQNLSLTAAAKYQHFLQKYPGLEQRVSQKHIASYLGITPVFLSMLRKRWATFSSTS